MQTGGPAPVSSGTDDCYITLGSLPRQAHIWWIGKDLNLRGTYIPPDLQSGGISQTHPPIHEIGAGKGTQTLGLDLGKVALYQLSYARVHRPSTASRVARGSYQPESCLRRAVDRSKRPTKNNKLVAAPGGNPQVRPRGRLRPFQARNLTDPLPLGSGKNDIPDC